MIWLKVLEFANFLLYNFQITSWISIFYLTWVLRIKCRNTWRKGLLFLVYFALEFEQSGESSMHRDCYTQRLMQPNGREAGLEQKEEEERRTTGTDDISRKFFRLPESSILCANVQIAWTKYIQSELIARKNF